MEKTYGQLAFEAYTEKRGGKNHDGSPTPPWDALGDGVREGWETAALAAAKASVERYERDFVSMLRQRLAAVRVSVNALGFHIPKTHEAREAFNTLEARIEAPLGEPICASAEDFGLERRVVADPWVTFVAEDGVVERRQLVGQTLDFLVGTFTIEADE